jgi:hypothetical protein
MISKYRVVSVQWIDVYADSQDEAKSIAGAVYYNATPEEQDSFPSFVIATGYDEDLVGGEWNPSNEPF